MLKICGPKLAICGVIISIWGIFQLVLMGVFFFVQSPALIEDLPLDEEVIVEDALQNGGLEITAAYHQQVQATESFCELKCHGKRTELLGK